MPSGPDQREYAEGSWSLLKAAGQAASEISREHTYVGRGLVTLKAATVQSCEPGRRCSSLMHREWLWRPRQDSNLQPTA